MIKTLMGNDDDKDDHVECDGDNGQDDDAIGQ